MPRESSRVSASTKPTRREQGWVSRAFYTSVGAVMSTCRLRTTGGSMAGRVGPTCPRTALVALVTLLVVLTDHGTSGSHDLLVAKQVSLIGEAKCGLLTLFGVIEGRRVGVARVNKYCVELSFDLPALRPLREH
ncbi:hypothetical protein NP493_48g07031 [Ridgeia piscesae]|uniref:Uncharacterized protein n=1 Tax=Ridgeia piscesae TaxID=27915 RepID=A0AAD9PBJ4_RIDPI|nr:hypothetical protein NP493_48g07031 [Ridgeia piscesae]